MTKNHTPESIQAAIFETLSQIQGVIYDFWNADMAWTQAHARIQRHALELRILNQGDLPKRGEPLIVAQASARAIERARAARERLNASVAPVAGGSDKGPTCPYLYDTLCMSKPPYAPGPDHHERCPNHRPAAGGEVVQTSDCAMSFADESLEEGSADVEEDAVLSLHVGAAGTELENDHCLSCDKPMGPGSRAVCAAHHPETGAVLVLCLDCYGTEPPAPAP